jgi:hypothetical protein
MCTPLLKQPLTLCTRWAAIGLPGAIALEGVVQTLAACTAKSP